MLSVSGCGVGGGVPQIAGGENHIEKDAFVEWAREHPESMSFVRNLHTKLGDAHTRAHEDMLVRHRAASTIGQSVGAPFAPAPSKPSQSSSSPSQRAGLEDQDVAPPSTNIRMTALNERVTTSSSSDALAPVPDEDGNDGEASDDYFETADGSRSIGSMLLGTGRRLFGFTSASEQPKVESADSQFRARLSSRLLTDFEQSEPRARPHSLRGDGDAPTPAAALFMASAAAANRRNSVDPILSVDDAKPTSPMGTPGSPGRRTEAKLPLDGGEGAEDARKADGLRGVAESKD